MCKLDSVDHAKGITAVREGDLQHARAETVQGLRDVRLTAFRCNRERTQEYALGALGELLEIVECRLGTTKRAGFFSSRPSILCCHI